MKKEKLNWIYKAVFVALIGLLTGNTLLAQTIDKTIEKIADIDENVLISVKNSNFDLSYKTWDKSKLKVEYTIHIEAKTNEDLNEFHNELEKEIEKQLTGINSGEVNISYPFKKYVQNNNKVKIVFHNSSKTHYLTRFKASIVIYAPKKNELNLSGSFCKVNIDNLEANATIKISSGKLEMGDCKKLKLQSSFCKNMKVGNVVDAIIKLSSGGIFLNEIKNNLELNASFSNFEATKIGENATVKLSSSTFQTSDIKELNLEGSFIRRFVVNNVEKATIIKFSSSEFRAQNIKNLNIEKTSFSTFRVASINKLMVEKSSSSKFYITAANIIDAPQCSFTNFSIGQLKKRFVTKSSSGSIELENVAEGFEKIKVDGQFVNINIGVERGAGYRIKVDLEFPNFKSEQINFGKKIDEVNTQYFVGWKGDDKEASSEIEFNCKSCSIRLD
jgi:hypothetical protein